MNKEAQEVVVYPDKMKSLEPLSFEDIRTNTALVKKALKEVMKKGVDFGTVAGCGDKLGLFKPGSEKLMLMFKLGCFPEAMRLHDNPDALEFIVRSKIIHLPTGIELGVGLGSASSNEEKYKWRKAVCKEEFEETPEERRRYKWVRGANREKAFKIEQVRTNPDDLNNTLLKMACKRSKVDGVITCTAASDIFTQDMEDEEVPSRQVEESPLKKPAAKRLEEIPPAGQEEPFPAGYTPLEAVEAGTCKGCKQAYKKGEKMAFNPKKGIFHKDCVAI